MRFIDDQRITQYSNAVDRIAAVAVVYQEALSAAWSARNRERYGLNPIDACLLEETRRHTTRVLELRRDELLDALDTVRDLIDDRPKEVLKAVAS